MTSEATRKGTETAKKQYYDVGTFICPNCRKPYIREGNLNRHMEKEKP